MNNGWSQSADAWIADMGEDGDFGRRYVLDPVMLRRAEAAAARSRDHHGRYIRGIAEALPFTGGSFDLVVSYLTLIDIPDIDMAVSEMARVLAPGGTLLIANLTSFSTPCADRGWVTDPLGRCLHYPIDHYMDDRAMWLEWRGIRILNYHRPMRRYMAAPLEAGLQLTWFDEPEPIASTPPERASAYRRVPWFVVTEWRKPAGR